LTCLRSVVRACAWQAQVLDELRARGRLELPRDVNTEDADLLAGPDDVSMRSDILCCDHWKQQHLYFDQPQCNS
jgi:hypothetical protein